MTELPNPAPLATAPLRAAEAASVQVEDCIATLAALMKDEATPASARVAACRIIMETAIGKARAPLKEQADLVAMQPQEMTDAQLRTAWEKAVKAAAPAAVGQSPAVQAPEARAFGTENAAPVAGVASRKASSVKERAVKAETGKVRTAKAKPVRRGPARKRSSVSKSAPEAPQEAAEQGSAPV